MQREGRKDESEGRLPHTLKLPIQQGKEKAAAAYSYRSTSAGAIRVAFLAG